MAWVKLDDQFFINRKSRAVGVDGRALFVASLCWCAMQMNDGTFLASDVPTIAVLADVPEETAGRLVPFLWHPEGHDCAKCRDVGHTTPVPSGQFTVHCYLEANQSREQTIARREADARRQALYRDSDVAEIVKARDGSCCRYCGRQVNWKDRRSSAGATLDHIDPRGPNTAGNVVVACRGCNSMKKDRTPEAAGMKLLEIHPSLDQNQNGSSDSSRPVPSRPTRGFSSQSSSSNSQGTGPPVDNHDDENRLSTVPDETWGHYAQLMLDKQPAGSVKKQAPWKAKTADNARVEHYEQAATWWAMFEGVRAHDLAAWLIDGKPGPTAQRRTENGTTP